MNIFRLSIRMLRRDWRAGELRILLVALLVAAGSVATVGFFADRVQGALNAQANHLLGADLVLIADHPVPETLEREAFRRGLGTAQTVVFRSMVSGAGPVQLAEIKAVSPGYPLRGRLRVAPGPFAPDAEARGVPAPGTVWAEERLLARLDIQVGDFVEVGSARLKLAAVLTREPDSALEYFNVAPRVLMNLADLPATRLIQPGSRVSYRLLVAGTPEVVQAYRDWAALRLGRGERLEGVRDARAEVRTALERAQQFLGLAALLSVVLAAVAVALAARRFSQRHLDGCAILRCLGASQPVLFRLYFYQFLLLGTVASALGCALGFAAQFVLAHWLAGFMTVELPLPTMLPALQGVLTGLTLLLGFAVPPLLRLRQVPTLRVLRHEVGVAETFSLTAYALGFAAIAGLILWKAGELKLGLIVLGGLVASLVAVGLVGWGLLAQLARLRGHLRGALRYGLANMRRRAWGSLVQTMALALGIMALLLLTLVRGDLMRTWQASLPPDTPNRFVINIQPDQLEDLQRFFAEKKLVAPELYPMIRGRLMAIDGRPVAAADYPDERARRLAEREFNLSYARDLRPDNRIVAGSWWKPGDSGQLSVEEGIAGTLGIRLGDTLTFEVAGTQFIARVTNLRKVNWDSFKVNFFVIASPGVLEGLPASYITSFYLPPANEAVVNELVRAFPNFTVIDVSALMHQVRTMSDQVARAVEFVFLFTLAAGLVVLYAAIAATQDERVFEGAIMRTLGAKHRQLVLAQLSEFLAIGFLAGTVAAIGASAVGYAVSEQVLKLPYEFNFWVPLAGVFFGTLGVALAGLAGTRSTLAHPPLQTIRRLA